MSARQAYKERLGSPRIGLFVVKCVGTLLGFQDCPNGGWCGMVIIDFVEWQEKRGRLTDFEQLVLVQNHNSPNAQ
jgi:hypothetical protein